MRESVSTGGDRYVTTTTDILAVRRGRRRASAIRFVAERVERCGIARVASCRAVPHVFHSHAYLRPIASRRRTLHRDAALIKHYFGRVPDLPGDTTDGWMSIVVRTCLHGVRTSGRSRY